MRSEAEIRERIQLSIVEIINHGSFEKLASEPENFIPAFVQQLTDTLTEITLDEITFRRR